MPHTDTPVGMLCYHCDEAIEINDEGEMIAQIGSIAACNAPEIGCDETAIMRPIHRECLIRSIIGSLGHLRKQCSCYGGKEEDPPGMTKRQAAIAACNYFDGKREQ